MPIKQYDLHVLMRHYWRKGLKIQEATDEINEGGGAGTVGKSTVGKWFKHFKEGNFDLEDKPRSGRPSVLDESDLQAELDIEPSSSTRELAEELGVSQMIVARKLHEFDFVHKKPRQDPHELTEAQAAKRAEICRQLLTNPCDDRFWKQIVTSDEKWIFLVNHNRQKKWVPKRQTPPSVPKQNRFGKKVMQQDNAKPHTAKKTKDKFEELDGVEVLPHPAYSPDCAPSDLWPLPINAALFEWPPI
jgi:histone-lysine N-methyltransferase SETMAR